MGFDSLYKGFEVELFTGTLNSHVGISNNIEKNFSNFIKETDAPTKNGNIKSLSKKLSRFTVKNWITNKKRSIANPPKIDINKFLIVNPVIKNFNSRISFFIHSFLQSLSSYKNYI